MISKDKQYRTRDGREARIYATDGGYTMPVHGAVKTGGHWVHNCWNSEGKNTSLMDSSSDLVEVKSRIKREYWISIYDTHDVLHTTEHHAKQYNQQWIPDACVKVVIDCEEGEGL